MSKWWWFVAGTLSALLGVVVISVLHDECSR